MKPLGQDENEAVDLSRAVVKVQQAMAEMMTAQQSQANGIRAALMAFAYAIAKQPAIDAHQFYADASHAINAGFEQDEAVPIAATEFLAQLHAALER